MLSCELDRSACGTNDVGTIDERDQRQDEEHGAAGERPPAMIDAPAQGLHVPGHDRPVAVRS